jgi:hypothetical protein
MTSRSSHIFEKPCPPSEHAWLEKEGWPDAKVERRMAHAMEQVRAITRCGQGRSDAKHGNLKQEILWKTDCRVIGQAAAVWDEGGKKG